MIGTIKAVQTGILDNPFSSHPAVACKVMGVKDSTGAVRYMRCGNLPFSKEMMKINNAKIMEREKLQDRKADYEMVIEDLTSISKGLLIGKGRSN